MDNKKAIEILNKLIDDIAGDRDEEYKNDIEKAMEMADYVIAILERDTKKTVGTLNIGDKRYLISETNE